MPVELYLQVRLVGSYEVHPALAAIARTHLVGGYDQRLIAGVRIAKREDSKDVGKGRGGSVELDVLVYWSATE